MKKIDRFKGSFVGLATGDALGTTLEFSPPGSFTPIKKIQGGGPFSLKPGQWTDDTSMALCLAESLIEKKKFDAIDQLQRYSSWHKEGHLSSNGECFDIGMTTLQSLEKFEKTHLSFCGSTDKNTSGNGSIMRLAPVPLFFAKDPIKAIFMSGESSKTTHGSKISIDACRYLGSIIWGLVNEKSKDEVLSSKFNPAFNYWKNFPLTKEIQEIRQGSFKNSNPPKIKGDGYAANSLEAALWAFYKSKTFQEGCLLAVNLGDDADTTGAVYGQIAGAYYGFEKIPKSWRSKIAHLRLIESMAEKIFEDSKISE